MAKALKNILCVSECACVLFNNVFSMRFYIYFMSCIPISLGLAVPPPLHYKPLKIVTALFIYTVQ
jgi:hypothetical protein